MWREAAIGLELAALLGDPVWQGVGVPDGAGRPVLLVPGFLAGDGSLRVMAAWLKRNGYDPMRAGIRSNRDCAGATLDRLEALVRERAAAAGERIAVVGQSRGGSLARALAVRAPDAIAGIITLGSPMRDPLAIKPFTLGAVRLVAALGDRGVPGLLSSACLDGSCCAGFYRDLRAPVPRDVGFVSIYSRTDGMVDWRSCLDPAAELAEVHSSHAGMSVHPRVYRAIATALSGGHRADRPRATRRG
jgi:triacylglycerol lipase